MAVLQDWLPPSKANWSLIVRLFTWFPTITLAQWVIPWYSMGKTSQESRLNIPGKIAWIAMELPGPLIMSYTMYTLPAELGLKSLPWKNWALGGIFITHYLYRAVLSPLLNPSMSPIHPLILLMGWSFQLLNAVSLSGWLAGHGPVLSSSWTSPHASTRMTVGFAIWALGFASTIWHDDELRELRRAAARTQARRGKGDDKNGSVDKVYVLPQNGLFRYVLCPHYFCEWVEWTGFWIMCGVGCVPARNFVLNEVATMLPRALQAKRWYVQRFGREKVGGRKAVIPGII